MKFWDSSALLPLCLDMPQGLDTRPLLKSDSEMIVWWGSDLEVVSALHRLRREKVVTEQELSRTTARLQKLQKTWHTVRPSNIIKEKAKRVIRIHGLKSADSLQLAAALAWAHDLPGDFEFVTLDKRLKQAALVEGFAARPE